MQQQFVLMLTSVLLSMHLQYVTCTAASTSSSSAAPQTLSYKIGNENSLDNRENIVSASPVILPGFSAGSSSSSDDSDEGNESVPSEVEDISEEEDDDNDYDDFEDTDYGNSELSAAPRQDSEVESSTTKAISNDALNHDTTSSTSKPLRTLKKLQAMLEDTDYATATSSPTSITLPQPKSIPPPPISLGSTEKPNSIILSESSSRGKEDGIVSNRLWTSKDRSKYKLQQRKLQKERQRYLEQHSTTPSDDDTVVTDVTDGTDDTDDGLGYTLPNLPIYLSDGESTETDEVDLEDGNVPQPKSFPSTVSPPQTLVSPPQRSSPTYSQSNPGYPPEQQGQGPPYRYQYQPNTMQVMYPNPQQQMPLPYQYPQGSYNPYQYPPPNQYIYNDPSNYNTLNIPPPRYGMPPPQHQYGPWSQAYPSQYLAPNHQYSGLNPNGFNPQSSLTFPLSQQNQIPSLSSGMKAIETVGNAAPNMLEKVGDVSGSIQVSSVLDPSSTSPTSTHVSSRDLGDSMTFDSLQKITFYAFGILFMTYAAVSPRTLSAAQYNMEFKKNLSKLLLAFLPSVGYLISVIDREQNNFNSLVGTFYATATLGYSLAFILEVVVTTIIRIGVFMIWEPAVFSLTPDVPLIILPWALRESNYRPKRITLLVADILASCLAAPFIEEYVKLKVVQLVTKLPKNFIRKKKEKNNSSSKKKKKSRKTYAMEPVVRSPDDAEVTNINCYVSHFMAASMGMKFCDTTRRVLMYTKPSHVNKSFYALVRGFYPIHELCGVMTAIELAKRDVLGLDNRTWRLVLPAAFVHAVASLKGKKPLFKWNSSAPWSELGLWVPGSIPNDAPLSVRLSVAMKTGGWFFIILRVLGYCVKNYYMVRRNAIKRVTTFAGKNASFSAELEAAALLKKARKDK